MSKALLLSGPDGSCASGDEHPISGAGGANSGDTNASHVATESMTVSGTLVRITSGNSGSATFRLRVNGANGNCVATRSGTGDVEDTTNSDSLSAGDNINYAYTDTGTNSGIAYLRTLVEFASGHGNIHGVSGVGGIIFDVASATRYIGLGGSLLADGTATIANAQWKVRGYTTVEAIQCIVSANARTNTSTISLNVNGTDVGSAISIGAAATGEFTVTGMAQALSPGDLVCLSITLSTGIEDLTLRTAGVTFKSTGNASETFCGNYNGVARTASATASYYPIGAQMFDSAFTEANQRLKVGFAARCTNLRCYVSANTYTGDATLKLYKNGSAVITVTITAGVTGWFENTSDTTDITDTDELSLEIDEGTANSATFTHAGFTLAAIPAATARGLALLGVGA